MQGRHEHCIDLPGSVDVRPGDAEGGVPYNISCSQVALLRNLYFLGYYVAGVEGDHRSPLQIYSNSDIFLITEYREIAVCCICFIPKSVI